MTTSCLQWFWKFTSTSPDSNSLVITSILPSFTALRSGKLRFVLSAISAAPESAHSLLLHTPVGSWISAALWSSSAPKERSRSLQPKVWAGWSGLRVAASLPNLTDRIVSRLGEFGSVRKWGKFQRSYYPGCHPLRPNRHHKKSKD